MSCQQQSVSFVNGTRTKSLLLSAHTHTGTHNAATTNLGTPPPSTPPCPARAVVIHGRQIELVAQRSRLNLLLISLVNTLMTWNMVGREGERGGEGVWERRLELDNSIMLQVHNVCKQRSCHKLWQLKWSRCRFVWPAMPPSLSSSPLFLPLAPTLLNNLTMWRHLKQSANSALNKAAARAAVMPASSLRVYFKFGQSCMSINRQQAGQGRYSPPPLSLLLSQTSSMFLHSVRVQ